MPETQTKTEQKQKKKLIKEIFSDYETKSNIKEAEIDSLTLIKKKSTLAIVISSKEYIDIKEIWFFEKFLMERFFFKNIEFLIHYDENVKIKPIESEWKNIICYMAHKYPLAKPLLLMKSDIKIENNTIIVKMHIKGAEFLKAKKTDKELERVLKNIFGKEYKVEITEDIKEKDLEEYQEKAREIEEEEIGKIVSHDVGQKTEEKHFNQGNSEVPNYTDPYYKMPDDLEGYIPEGEELGYPPEYGEIENEAENAEVKEYIMGKPSKAKEKKVKIKEITANDGRVTLEGRILTCEARETKSGKGMLIFDLYDGTGTMTCKSFAKDITEGNEISEKIKNSKAIKIIGKAGLDTYAGDVSVIANTIIELENTDVPELPSEDDEDTPLILGTTPVINEPLVKIS